MKNNSHAGLPVIYENNRLEVTTTSQETSKQQVAIFIDYLELFPGHNGDAHIHAIIHLTPGFRDDKDEKTTPSSRIFD